MRCVFVLVATCTLAYADPPVQTAPKPTQLVGAGVLSTLAVAHPLLFGDPGATGHYDAAVDVRDSAQALSFLGRTAAAFAMASSIVNSSLSILVHGSPVHVVPVTNTDATEPGHTAGLGVQGRF